MSRKSLLDEVIAVIGSDLPQLNPTISRCIRECRGKKSIRLIAESNAVKVTIQEPDKGSKQVFVNTDSAKLGSVMQTLREAFTRKKLPLVA